ncbi:PDZ domain-containing protein [Spirosoma sp. KCTC 42546]|uniref:S41 family peptidase n=1 Tax=Spirosoma sp. KCTC 42546 TaxID=2520506 RepID=UPI001159F02A|nr:S41 family peptidase [Spirosoma sp. KCTC 42546]QDK77414.1 PDZ domain-containing protein [Spirosoma sp. KCTC 42546]
MNTSFAWRTALSLVISSSFLMTSCKKEDVAPSGPTSNGEVNNWVLENMKNYYFWNDKLPAKPDTSLTPDQFFLSLLYDRANTANADRDRFSWIQASADELKASLSGQSKTTGIEYNLYYRDQTRTNVVASIIYVLPGSPAAKAGIKRGDIISKVNGEALTGTNYQTMLAGSSDTYTYGFATVSNGALTDNAQTKQVTAVVFQEDPVLLDTTYTIGGKTIGYVIYNQFIPGLYKAGSSSLDNTYDLKLDNIFVKFKQKGVNELVLDLRYNRGGYVSSSTNLASLIGKNIDASKVYYTQKWNSIVTAQNDKQRGVGWNTQNFLVKAANIGANLSRVFVLTTGSTASASELVINGLRPFMTVTTIGTTTVGKNVGSITISDETGRIKWGIQPITFKSANAQGFTDYAGGFTPSVEVKEPSYAMKAFGDVTEPMLSEAIFQISGTRTVRRAASTDVTQPILGSSLDGKAGGGNMFFTDKLSNVQH